MASSLGHDDIVRRLIGHGADLNAECRRSVWPNVTPTALHVALFNEHTPVARILLDHGANPDTPDTKGATALHLALEWPREVTAVELLLQYGADVNSRDKNGRTPLHKAADKGILQIVEVLLNHGGDPHAQNDDGKTPIQLVNKHWGISAKEIIRLLSERTGERM
jgi:ankyrin repeat protein